MLDQRGQLLRAAVGFAGCALPLYDRALRALRAWLDSWSGIGRVAVGMARQGYDLQLTRYDRAGLARDVLHNRDGALADEHDGHRMGAHAVARDAAGGVGAEGGGVNAMEATTSALAAPHSRVCSSRRGSERTFLSFVNG